MSSKKLTRKKYAMPSNIQCSICNEYISSYAFSSHINKHAISVDSYVLEFGEFRKSKLQVASGKRNISKIKCLICGNEYSSVGIAKHLRDSHSIIIQDYINQYGEYRTKYLNIKEKSKKNNISCLVCNKHEFTSYNHLAYHIRQCHILHMKEYIQRYIFKNEIQYCKCGCQKEVKFINTPPYRREYIAGHNPNGMKSKIHSDISKNLMSQRAISRTYKMYGKSNTIPELKFKEWADKNKIVYISQIPTKFGCIDFYLPEYDLYVEIDGVYWHPLKLEYLNIQLLSSVINQFKRLNLNNLIRIREDQLDKLNDISTINQLYSLNYTYDYSVKTKQKIVYKEYINTLSANKRKLLARLFHKFISIYYPSFQYPLTDENLSTVIKEIQSRVFKFEIQNNTFNNNSSNIGISYLKSNFKSYWKSSFKGNKTPIEAWQDLNLLYKIIEYRVGLNKKRETFDLSFQQILRGISANRISISFFKPLLAAQIYYHFLGDKKNPIVLDPCSGFGGRLLGFKSIYPDGTYIGIEPNLETFKELELLGSNFNNVHLYNCKFEDFHLDVKNQIDLTFTSIPYYDLEVYSNSVLYENYDQWKLVFLTKILKCPNLILNIPVKMRADINISAEEFFIQSNTSHFDKSKNKFEYLLKINYNAYI
jgi:hypothetical protein